MSSGARGDAKIVIFAADIDIMNWQNIIVYVIGAAVFMWLVRAVIRGMRVRKYSKCDACGDSVCPYRTNKKGGDRR